MATVTHKSRLRSALGAALVALSCSVASACGGSSSAAVSSVSAGSGSGPAAAQGADTTTGARTGTGAGSATGNVPAAPPSPAFAAHAGAICRSSNKQIAVALLHVVAAKPGGSGWVAAEHEFMAAEQRLRALRAPQQVASLWQTLLTQRASLATALAAPADLSTGAGRTLAVTRRRLRAQVSASAAGAGVKDCGTVG
ncbi:MAG: hypothetical protein ACYDC2_11500 [Solirubrobacteraceae bacterium]